MPVKESKREAENVQFKVRNSILIINTYSLVSNHHNPNSFCVYLGKLQYVVYSKATGKVPLFVIHNKMK